MHAQSIARRWLQRIRLQRGPYPLQRRLHPLPRILATGECGPAARKCFSILTDCRASVGTSGLCKHHKRDARRTLLEICVERFGSCDAELLREIRRLNPGLSNLDHIEPGQKIRLPVSEADPERLVSSGEKGTQ